MIGASWGIEWCVVGLDRNWSCQPGLQDGAAVVGLIRPRAADRFLDRLIRGRASREPRRFLFYFHFVLGMFTEE